MERGFSVNKQLEVVNLQERAYVAQGIICDQIHFVGVLLNVVINKPLLAAASGARQRYQTDLDPKKALKSARDLSLQ